MTLPTKSNAGKVGTILSVITVVIAITGAIWWFGISNERVERANEEVEKATAELDNVVRSQIQKCIAKYGYGDGCHAVVLEYKGACNTDLAYMDLPVCVDGTLDEYIKNYNP